ncbi:MAG: RNA polymerase sigma-70 factor [Chitinophagaceae bacterium]
MVLTDEAFEDIFVKYYESLYGYAFSILNNELSAEEIVSDVFYRLWLKKGKLKIDISLPGYLYKSVYNACMDNMRHNKVKQLFKRESFNQPTENTSNVVSNINAKDFEKHLRNALLKLPEQCRTVFQLNRMEELTYNEIAKRLNISVKTVEAHMSKALKRLRVSMAEFLTLLIILLWH